MEIQLTTTEIKAILEGCRYLLRVIQSKVEYRQIEASEYFSTTNDLVLNDATNALFEVIEGIEEYERVTNQFVSTIS